MEFIDICILLVLLVLFSVPASCLIFLEVRQNRQERKAREEARKADYDLAQIDFDAIEKTIAKGSEFRVNQDQ